MFPFEYQMVMHGEEPRRKRLCRGSRQNNYCTIAALCRDLLMCILLPLPARTLVGLRLVCKLFDEVISCSLFGILHLRTHHKDRQSLAPTSLYFYSSFSNTPEIYSVAISDPAKTPPPLSAFESIGHHIRHRFRIVQSCNGLLLCSFDNNESSSERIFVVCNPTISTYNVLPELPPLESSSSRSKKEEEICHPVLTLAFNPLRTHVYKVFAVRAVKQLARKSTFEVLVYSSDQGGRVWRKSGCQFFTSPGMKRIHHGVFHDGGNITWICETGFIYFNVETENIIEVPKGTMRSSTWRKISFFGESIDGGLQLIKPTPSSNITVYQLRPGTSYWDYQCILTPRYDTPIVEDEYQILAVDNERKQLIFAIPGMVLRYCQQSRRSWEIKPMPQRSSQNFSLGHVTSFQFIETLSPV